MLEKMLQQVREKRPLVHHITNYVTVNDCANIVLACGGSPIMADDIAEVADITSLCSALVINIGTLNERTVASMIEAGKQANRCGHPVILDPVGVGASRLRTETTRLLLENVRFAVIRGNLSELKALCDGTGTSGGVDVDQKDAAAGLEYSILAAKEAANQTGAVVVLTGKVDVITDGAKTMLVYNGTPLMASVTGTGCMLSSVVGAFCGANADDILNAAAAATAAMGLCGELAFHEGIGTASYRAGIIDAMSLLTEAKWKAGARIEIR